MEDVKTKECYFCHNFKEFKDFNKCITGLYGFHNHCRSCQKIVRRNWYLKNRETELLKGKEYSKTEQAKEDRKRYWQKNKHIRGPKNNERRRLESVKIKIRIQRNNWRLLPQNRIACSLRGRLRYALKNRDKLFTTETLIGCSFEFLVKYLESLWLPNMNWDNYGEWHIDHILPCSSFDLTQEENQRKCFHYTNLQPLWGKENIKKGNKIIIDYQI